MDNYEVIDSKTGEIQTLSKEDIQKVINFWINTPSSNEINGNNIFKSVGMKNIKLSIPEKSSQIVLNIQAHRNILDVLSQYNINFRDVDNSFYNELLLQLYYFKNRSSRIEHIIKVIEKYGLNLDDKFLDEVASLDGMDGFGSFSLKFINEVLEIIKTENKLYHEALEKLGYFSKYLDMPSYDYLPPLEPTTADIQWLQENIPYFETKHLFYQPMISPKVKRVLSILRKLINDIIKQYGKIDEIRIETAKELNTKKEKENIDKNQSKDKKKNDEAIKFLKNQNIKESLNNIERVKLWKEQGGFCLYSGREITKDELFDENETEIEHFIPRSVIWINSYKNKILVKKKYNQNKGSLHPIQYLNSIGQWEDFCGRVTQTFMDFKKKDWLTKEDIINSVMKKEHWSDSFLNDTRTATRTIQKYLNHYLYPKENLYGKDEKRSIFSVSGKAISELKYIWGISDVMPKNEDGKKDRDTNYHHTLDAFTVALCSSGAINTLHNYFIKKENKFKTKVLKEKLTLNTPVSKDGVNVIEHLKNLVEKYETNKLYVCPYNKRKTNMKGFKDGNLKLYVTKDLKDETKEILAEIEKVAIDTSILIKSVGGFPKPRTDEEVRKEIQSIQERLDNQKQKNIISAIEIYAKGLLDIRSQVVTVEDEIKEVKITLKNGDKNKEYNAPINEKIKELTEQKNQLSKSMEKLRCSFDTKNGKKQIVRSLKLYKPKREQTKADVIIFPNRQENKIERLSVPNFKKALEEKEPFVTKMNETTLNVELFNTEKRGQAVGLNYFSSIKNDISTKINNRYNDEIVKNSKSDLVLYKSDIIKAINIKEGIEEYYIFNGGGDVTGTNNKLVVKNINNNLFQKVDKKGEIKYTKEDKVSPSNKIIISKVDIDFFGNIKEV
ncbi:MAG: type II CRISPR RNA-guided endonuclease Cas9 [Arcobacteraceae bacterium]|nr:type II CRISPR RNA-guided endonuclease Cas9 [Arcobacteraceae bacterium]